MKFLILNKTFLLFFILGTLFFACKQGTKEGMKSGYNNTIKKTVEDSLLQKKLDSIRLLIENKKNELLDFQHKINEYDIYNKTIKQSTVKKPDSTLKNQIHQLSLNFSALQSDKKKLLKTIDSLNQINDFNFKRFEKKNAELEKDLFLKQKYENEISDLKKEKTTLEKKLDSANILNLNFKRSVNNYNNQINNLNDKIKKEQKNKNQLEKQIAILQRKLENYDLNMQKKENTDTLIEQNIVALKKEKSEATNLLLQANKTIFSLQQNMSEKTDALKYVKGKNKNLEKELQEDRFQKNKLKMQYDSLQELMLFNQANFNKTNRLNPVNNYAGSIKKQLDSLKTKLIATNNKLDSTEKLLNLKNNELSEKDILVTNQKMLTNKLFYDKDSIEKNLKNLVRVNDSLNKIAQQLKNKDANEVMAENYKNEYLLQQIDSLTTVLKITSKKLDSTDNLQNGRNEKINKLKAVSEKAKNNTYNLTRIKDSLDKTIFNLSKRNDSLQKLLVNKKEGKKTNNIDSNLLTELVDSTSLIQSHEVKNTVENKIIYFPLNTSRIKIKLTNKKVVEKYIERYIEAYLKRKSSLKLFTLKEYFFFYIDTLGEIVKIEDQRTEFNKNTKIFKNKNIDSLKIMRFRPVVLSGKKTNVKAALGIEINIQQTKYEYRLQKNKIRVYKTPLYVEYIEQGDDDYKIIFDALSKYSKITNKFYITIIKGNYSIKEFSQKEYNPFEKAKSVLLKQDILKITNIRGIR